MRTLRKPTRMSLYWSESQKLDNLEVCAEAGRAWLGIRLGIGLGLEFGLGLG